MGDTNKWTYEDNDANGSIGIGKFLRYRVGRCIEKCEGEHSKYKSDVQIGDPC